MSTCSSCQRKHLHKCSCISGRRKHLKLASFQCHGEEPVFLWYPAGQDLKEHLLLKRSSLPLEGDEGYWEEGRRKGSRFTRRKEAVLVIDNCKTCKRVTKPQQKNSIRNYYVFLKITQIAENKTFRKGEGIVQVDMTHTLPEFLDTELDTKNAL